MKNTLFKTKQNIGIGIVTAIALFSSSPSYALTVQEVPNPRQIDNVWVTDLADILSDRTESQLNQMISQLETYNGTEIAVVTVPETSPSSSPKEFTTELFNYWGIGKADRDNGVLFLISVGDRRTEIETGYGIEGILPDAKVGNIIDTQIIPQFKQKNFDAGTLAGTQELISAVKASANQELTTTVTSEKQELIAGDRARATENQELTTTTITSEEQTLITSDRERATENINNLVTWVVFFSSLLLIIHLILRQRKVFVRPDQVRKRIRGNGILLGDRPIFCATCKQKMENVAKIPVTYQLSKPEKIAQKIGSIRFEEWKCPNCSHQPVLIGYISPESMFRECHNCQELTVTRTKKTLKYATRFSEGKRLVIDKCHCCDYYREKEETIPCLPPPPPPPSSSSGGSCGGSSGGSSGGSFGGGSSGGGGAGGSW